MKQLNYIRDYIETIITKGISTKDRNRSVWSLVKITLTFNNSFHYKNSVNSSNPQKPSYYYDDHINTNIL
ncbi:hypothetical protein BLOT_007586 [Blomia tropicalis]|nr:hypothetical protein BLOT_007586 [Blomia tropicalis]